MSLLDIKQILDEAKSRWLRPSEVCEIIRNYQKFHLTPDPPYKPSGGSLFLFDRKALRYFRKDGHRWRKKKDGKTVREAHEKLKSGSVDVLHCYYAHGEDNENFQRRSYWMLDGQLEHIVLVHYREVNETNSWGAQTTVAAQSSYVSTPNTVGWNGQAPSSELEDVDSGEDFSVSPLVKSISDSCFQISPILNNESSNTNTHVCVPYSHASLDMASLSAQSNPFYETSLSGSHFASEDRKIGYRTSQDDGILNERERVSMGSFIGGVAHASTSYVWTGPCLDADVKFGQVSDACCENFAFEDRRMYEGILKHEHIEYIDSLNRCKNTSNDFHSVNQVPRDQILGNDSENSCEKNAYQHELLNKLDSFGRWMNKELGQDCEESLMATDSGTYWNALDTHGDDKEVSSLSCQMQLDIGLLGALGPSLSQEQLFSILDFSPDWAYSGCETKVLISGVFLGAVKPGSIKWCCMFGEIEVTAEVLTGNVLRCQAPIHLPGRVPFYITCSNRLACSEIREFEYREKQSGELTLAQRNELKDETCLQVRFAKMLSLGVDRSKVSCSIEKCSKCDLKEELFFMLHVDKIEWEMIEKDQKEFEVCYGNPKDALLQKLLKDKLYEWLVSKCHEDDKGPHVLDDEGQGVIHLAAALGYEWAVNPIVTTGVSPNFRDARGRSALHWAAYYGREETVATLIRLGASPGVVEDPTMKFREGRTAADLASSRGYKGIAGYLAEADLACQLSSLTVKESVMNSVSATLAAEKAVETLEDDSVITLDIDRGEQLSLRGSLAAVRNSAQAAARIQAAFRVHSFRQRQARKCDEELSDISEKMLVSSLNNRSQRTIHYNDSLHTAALRIQQKYRGWKGRKEFVKLRTRVIKLQAHVRGHQVRRQYKKFVWSVGIVEKAILRWRRKGTGLRGFRAELATVDGQLNKGKVDDYDFLRLGRKQKVAGVERALARVQSMARSSEARGQYMRLVASAQKSGKTGDQVETSDGR